MDLQIIFGAGGCEDKDLQNRAEYKRLKITKNILCNDPKRNEYFKIFNDHTDADRKMCHHNFVYHHWAKFPNKEQYIAKNGLSTLIYKKIKEEVLADGVKKITVKF